MPAFEELKRQRSMSKPILSLTPRFGGVLRITTPAQNRFNGFPLLLTKPLKRFLLRLAGSPG